MPSEEFSSKIYQKAQISKAVSGLNDNKTIDRCTKQTKKNTHPTTTMPEFPQRKVRKLP